VGTALVQIARRHKCIIYGLTTSPAKLDTLRASGVDFPLCVTRKNFDHEVRRVCPVQGLDVIFDPIGGRFVRKGFGLLRSGGRIVCLGISDIASGRKSWGRIIRSLAGLGLVHPAVLMQKSKGIIGVNMLATAGSHPGVIERCLAEVVPRALTGEFKPVVGHIYGIDRLAEAHSALERKQTVGKLAVRW
jgi:NADPH:quinone reductase-like Zn-dependent oxidoreductase